MMNDSHINDFDDEDRQLVLDFENTVLRGGTQFFDVDELEVIIDYYFEVNDLEPLRRAVEYAEQLYPDSTTVRLRRAHLYIAQEQYEPALRIITELRRQEPDNTDAAYSMGVAYSAIKESRKAIKCFLEAAEDGWMLGRIYGNIAEEYYNLHDYNEAIRYYQLALDTDSYDNTTLSNFVDTCYVAHRADDAVKYLKSFVGEHPYCCEAWHGLGNSYRELGLFELAADAYEYALAIDKKAFHVYFDLAGVQEAMGHAGEAVTTLLRGLDFTEQRSSVYRAAAYIHVRAGNPDMALFYFRKAVEDSPDDAEALASLAMAYAVTNEMDAAYPLIKRALRLAPDNSEVLCMAAIIYDTAENVEAASDYYERMVATGDCTEQQYQNYVHFLYAHQQYDMVIDFSEESLELYPQHPFYSSFLVAASFYTNRYNRASRSLPYVDVELLHELCPDIFTHPRLAQLIPEKPEIV